MVRNAHRTLASLPDRSNAISSHCTPATFTIPCLANRMDTTCILRILPVAVGTTHSILGRARAALERGRGAEAAKSLTPLLRSGPSIGTTNWRFAPRLAEAWLLQDDLNQAATALGRPPDTIREPIADATCRCCGGCTAGWRSPAATSHEPSRCTRVRSSTRISPMTLGRSVSRTMSSPTATSTSATPASSAST